MDTNWLVAFSKALLGPLFLLATTAGIAWLSRFTSGVALVTFLALAGATGLVGVVWALGVCLPGRWRSVIESWLGALALLAGSLAVGLVAIEGGLRLFETLAIELPSWPAPTPAQPLDDEPPYQNLLGTGKDDAFESLPAAVRERILARRSLLSMPESWRMRQTTVPGAQTAFYWHDALHVGDENGFRRSEPLPPPNPAKFRIMVIGDSLTYGYGVEEQWTYPRILERKLAGPHEVEVINLGIPGYNSEDIRQLLEKFYDRLKPDLVLYGICHNDFLNSGEGQRSGAGIELPKFFTERAKVASVLENGINAVGRSLGLMPDFHGQVFGGIKSYEKRFTNDLKRMNDFVRERSGRPVIALVLDQYPVKGGLGYRLTLVAEEAARRAGMDVIGTGDYYRTYHQHSLAVSTWEGHPDEWGHEVFARMFARRILEGRLSAAPARKASTTTIGPPQVNGSERPSPVRSPTNLQ